MKGGASHPGPLLWTLLHHSIDYAGLFPPAQLDMPGAVAEYASYLVSGDAWALGRFVVPASRLEELAEVAATVERSLTSSLGVGRPEWRLSALLGPDLEADTRRVMAFNAACDVDWAEWGAGIDGVELRASTPEAVAQALRVVPGDLERYVEIPISGETLGLVRAIGDAGAFAKVRTGGTTADAFPSSDDLAGFLATCVHHRVPFKATAGLHHPLRGDYSLTYEPASACGRMYGFLNVMLATAFLVAAVSEEDARDLLEEDNVAAVRIDESGISWRHRRLPVERVLEARTYMKSFGSCSFREPIDDLMALGLL